MAEEKLHELSKSKWNNAKRRQRKKNGKNKEIRKKSRSRKKNILRKSSFTKSCTCLQSNATWLGLNFNFYRLKLNQKRLAVVLIHNLYAKSPLLLLFLGRIWTEDERCASLQENKRNWREIYAQVKVWVFKLKNK